MRNNKLNFNQFKLLSFDCYGTLVDWRKSVLDIIHPVILKHKIDLSRDELFELFLESDRHVISGTYIPYKDVLTGIMEYISKRLSIKLHPSDNVCLVDRFGDWTPFPDTSYSLLELKKRYKLAIISNVDDELFNLTKRCLGVKFDFIVTAKQVGSYKPAENNFLMALEKFEIEPDQILHVAQSIYHDIVPTKKLGWHNVWVNRYNEPERTNPAEFPDLEVPDLATLVKIIELEL